MRHGTTETPGAASRPGCDHCGVQTNYITDDEELLSAGTGQGRQGKLTNQMAQHSTAQHSTLQPSTNYQQSVAHSPALRYVQRSPDTSTHATNTVEKLGRHNITVYNLVYK